MRFVAVAAAFVVGLGLGALGRGNNTETVTTAPQACDVALDYASEGFDRAAQAVRGGGVRAFADWMAANAQDMQAASQECRDAVR